MDEVEDVEDVDDVDEVDDADNVDMTIIITNMTITVMTITNMTIKFKNNLRPIYMVIFENWYFSLDYNNC